MPESIGTIINDPEYTNGTAGLKPDHGGATVPKVRTTEPEILYGTDFEEPRTASIGNSSDAGSGTARRTRRGNIDRRTREGRAGGTADTTALSSDLSKINLTDLLLSLHAMGAAFLATPELQLDDKEAAQLSEAVQKVGKYYAVAFDPKKVAIAELAVIMGGIYGTRFVAWKARMNKESQKEKLAVMAPPKQEPAKPQRPLTEMSPSELWPESGAIPGSF
jgi:hypothetical protein